MDKVSKDLGQVLGSVLTLLQRTQTSNRKVNDGLLEVPVLVPTWNAEAQRIEEGLAFSGLESMSLVIGPRHSPL